MDHGVALSKSNMMVPEYYLEDMHGPWSRPEQGNMMVPEYYLEDMHGPWSRPEQG